MSCGHIFLVFYLFIFFSDVVMASHGGDETKTISYKSKFLKYAPERAGGVVGEKKTESVVNCIYPVCSIERKKILK